MTEDPFGRTMFEGRSEKGEPTLSPAPGQWLCDFCATPNPTWSHECGRVRIAGNPNIAGSDDNFAACEDCHELIEAHDVEGLATRIVEVQAQQPLRPGWVQRPLLMRVQLAVANVRAFFDAASGKSTRL